MSDKTDDTLGPLPETDVWAIGSLDAREDVYAYSPEAMEAERQRCYALGVAAERERCAKLCESTYQEWNEYRQIEQRPCFDTPAECAAAIRALP